MKWSIAALLAAAVCLYAQTPAKDAAAAQGVQKQLTDAASAGTPLPATINVSDNVNIEAVMLPENVTRHVFGLEISRNYAVIEVNISNRSNDAGLIVQSLFIDLHDWGLAGPMSAGLTTGGIDSSSRPYQAKGSPLEVSSVEYRIVRGEMLDRQPWTARNLGLRIIQVMGSLGTSFAFPFTRDVVTDIGAWNGGVVPGFQILFPDGMQAQMDRVSDYGFRNNKVIPQQSADILIAFFPIKRFLTPGLKQVFLENPAVFFNPILMVLDPKTRQQLYPFLTMALGAKKDVDDQCKELLEAFAKAQAAAATAAVQYQEDLANLAKANAAVTQANAAVAENPKTNPTAPAQDSPALTAAKKTLQDQETKTDTDKSVLDKTWLPLTDVRLYNLLASLSLNNVHVVLSGILATDVDNVPATITSITCTNESQPATLWGAAGDRTCAIHGSFLTGGTPSIAEAAALGVTVTAVPEGSTDAVLNFKLSLTKPVPPKTVLTFQVAKKNKQGNTVESMKFAYTVPAYTPTPTIASVAVKDTTVTVTGTNFSDTAASPLAVTAHAVSPSGIADQKIAKPTSTLTQIQFDDKSFPPACWQVQVKVGSVDAPSSTEKPPKDQFALVPTPKIETATLTGTKLTVTGSEFIDLTACGEPLTFEVLSDATGAKPQAIAKADLSTDGKQATFDVPTPAQGTKWKEVHALIDAKQVATAVITAK